MAAADEFTSRKSGASGQHDRLVPGALGDKRCSSRPQEWLPHRGVAVGCIEKIERALVLYMVVAWRIARLMRLGRSCQDLDAQLMFEPDDWKAAYILNKQKLPDMPPTLNEVGTRLPDSVACMARKGDGEPGVKTNWLGMQRIHKPTHFAKR